MRSLPFLLVLASQAAVLALPVQAADPKVVAYFEETCGACHGPKGLGIPGLAPTLKGSAFVMTASVDEVAAVITKGRTVEQKKHANFPSPMPAHSMSDGRLKAIVAYIRDEIQK
jgi:thiosulfate dehydrogenase